MAVKRICRYLQGITDNVLVFNPHKKLVVGCYADEYFTGLWGHENSRETICARSIPGYVATYANLPLLWLSKLQTEIDLSTLHSGYAELSHSIIELLSLNSIIKEVIENLVIDSEKLKFVPSSTVY